MLNANILAVLVAAIAAFLVGGLWYGPLFGKMWQREVGQSDYDKNRRSIAKLVGLTIALELLSAFFLGHLLAHVAHSNQTIMMISAGMAIGFVIPSMLVNYLYAGKSARLMWIDGGHWIAVYMVMGVVFALFGV
jgi:hypothetical protein